MSSTSSEINVSLNDASTTDEQYINSLEQKKSAARNKKQQQQNQRQNQQLEQQQETQPNNDYYFSTGPPTIPYQAITEALKPNTGATTVQKIRNNVQCPICHAFQHYNRFVLKQHIESHIEFAEVRRFLLLMEREFKGLLKKRYELRKVELPRLQQQISELDSQIRRFKESLDTKDTALRIEQQITSRRQQGLKDFDDDPFVRSPTIFSLLEEEGEKGEGKEEGQEGGEQKK
jgi:hypothetical protein